MERLQNLLKELSSLLAIIAIGACLFVICWQYHAINQLRNEVYSLDETIDYNTSQLENLNIKMDDQEADRMEGNRAAKEFKQRKSLRQK